MEKADRVIQSFLANSTMTKMPNQLFVEVPNGVGKDSTWQVPNVAHTAVN